MKLLVVFTGGTIGSRLQNGYIDTNNNQKYELLKNIEGNIQVDIAEPYTTLSEQLNGEYITKLVKCVGDNLSKGYDGIIVTHGTDTLQYGAAALSCAFGNCKIPVVLVSSNYILSDSRANGYDNFNYGLKFMRENIGGVFVSYKNVGGRPEIHLGSRLLAYGQYSHDIVSLGGCFGYFEGDKFIRKIDVFEKDSFRIFSLSKYSPVLWLRPYAGMTLPDESKFKAVLFEGYHSGTLPTENEMFADFCKNCNVPIFLAGVPKGVKYKSEELYSSLNIQVLTEIPSIYAYIKLWIIAENSMDFNIMNCEL